MFSAVKKYILQQLSPNQRDTLLATKRYSLAHRINPKEQLLVFFVDGKFYHGGFCDRLKGAVSLFHYALLKGIPFRIIYTYPFQLNGFLLPNQYDWQMKEGELSNNFFEVRYLNLVGDATATRLIELHTKKQVQCYANRDIITELNTSYDTNYTWGELFKMLFKATEELAELINFHKGKIGGEYICAVYRFQQLLGDFLEYDFPELSTTEKEKLIEKNIDSIYDLIEKHRDKKILVTSDSRMFLERVEKIPDVYTLPGRVVHIDNSLNEEHEVYLKSFLDFYLLSEGCKIYSVGTNEMYKTEFPLYASKINAIPFERILLE